MPDGAVLPMMLTASSAAAAFASLALLALCAPLLLTWEHPLSSGPAGPKSGALGGSTTTWTTSTVSLGHFPNLAPKSRGEGSGRSMTSRGGTFQNWFPPRTSRNHHGLGHAAPHGATHRPQAVKRSLRRALGRALREGWTFYKGQMLSLPQ